MRRLSAVLALAVICCRRSLSFAVRAARPDVCMVPVSPWIQAATRMGENAESSHEIPGLHSDGWKSQKTRRAHLPVSLCETVVRREALGLNGTTPCTATST